MRSGAVRACGRMWCVACVSVSPVVALLFVKVRADSTWRVCSGRRVYFDRFSLLELRHELGPRLLWHLLLRVLGARAGAPERPNPASATNNTHQITWYWVCVVPTGVLPRILSVIYSIIVPLDMSVSSVLCGMIRLNRSIKTSHRRNSFHHIYPSRSAGGPELNEGGSGPVKGQWFVLFGSDRAPETFNRSIHGRRYGRTAPGADMKKSLFRPRNGRFRVEGYHFPGFICCI